MKDDEIYENIAWHLCLSFADFVKCSAFQTIYHTVRYFVTWLVHEAIYDIKTDLCVIILNIPIKLYIRLVFLKCFKWYLRNSDYEIPWWTNFVTLLGRGIPPMHNLRWEVGVWWFQYVLRLNARSMVLCMTYLHLVRLSISSPQSAWI